MQLRHRGVLSHSLFIPTPSAPRSLCWHGDTLIDWVAGGTRYTLQGEVWDPPVRYGYRFDSAVASPDGRFVVIYEALGTAALLLKEGRIVREIHRSSYHADVYEFPVALATLPSGRTLLAHCPDEYSKLEFEDAETGERLTGRTNRAVDFFHSRLQFSHDGRYLVSAGWVWHPLDAVWLVDVQRALEEPATLEKNDLLDFGDWGFETNAAVFGEQDRLLVTGSEALNDSAPREGSWSIGIYSITDRRMIQTAPLSEPAGTLMHAGQHAVGFYKSPRLIDLSTGDVVARWPESFSGEQVSSIRGHHPAPPPLAIDPQRRRFALGSARGIEVVRFSGSTKTP